MTGEGLVVTVDGLAIEGGQASDTTTGWVDKGGGGVQCIGASSVEFTNSDISNNTAEDSGGGIHSEGCDILLDSTTVYDNESDLVGGGVSMLGGKLTMTDSGIFDNTVEIYGGGIWSTKADGAAAEVVLNNSVVHGNGGGVFGGGLTIEQGSTATCNSTESGSHGVYNNDASVAGGGVHIFEGRFTSNGCDFGEEGSTLAPNDPDTVYASESATEYTFTNDATFVCTQIECES